MKKVQLNIGLENNPYEFVYVLELVKELWAMFSFKESVGKYDGNEERTFVSTMYSDYEEERILKQIEYLTIVFTQECIAVKNVSQSRMYRSQD